MKIASKSNSLISSIFKKEKNHKKISNKNNTQIIKKLIFHIHLFTIILLITKIPLASAREVTCDNLGICKIIYGPKEIYIPDSFTPNFYMDQDKYLKEESENKLYYNDLPEGSFIDEKFDNSVPFLTGSKKFQCADGLRECPGKCCRSGICSDPSNVCLNNIYTRNLIWIITGSLFAFLLIIYWIAFFYLGVKYNKMFLESKNIKNLDMIYRKPFKKIDRDEDFPDTEFDPNLNYDKYKKENQEEKLENENDNEENLNIINDDEIFNKNIRENLQMNKTGIIKEDLENFKNEEIFEGRNSKTFHREINLEKEIDFETNKHKGHEKGNLNTGIKTNLISENENLKEFKAPNKFLNENDENLENKNDEEFEIDLKKKSEDVDLFQPSNMDSNFMKKKYAKKNSSKNSSSKKSININNEENINNENENEENIEGNYFFYLNFITFLFNFF